MTGAPGEAAAAGPAPGPAPRVTARADAISARERRPPAAHARQRRCQGAAAGAAIARPPAGARERHYQQRTPRRQVRFNRQDFWLVALLAGLILLFGVSAKIVMDRVAASTSYIYVCPYPIPYIRYVSGAGTYRIPYPIGIRSSTIRVYPLADTVAGMLLSPDVVSKQLSINKQATLKHKHNKRICNTSGVLGTLCIEAPI